MSYLTSEQLHAALTLPDLTDSASGAHCMQQLVAAAVGALSGAWSVPALVWRGDRVVSVTDNYDALGYPSEGPARERRYSRYVAAGRLLRTQTSASVPGALRALAPAAEALIVVPGLVWRRDVIDRLHVGAPHQLDLWRVTAAPMTGA